jgi:hypothetical protein
VWTQLDAVSATLRESSRPTLPTAVERRIVSALAAEAARRRAGRSGGRRHAARASSLRSVIVPAVAMALAVCAGFGYLLSLAGTSSPSPVPVTGPPASLTAGPVPSGTASGASAGKFLVTDSHTSYRKATLRTQVSDTLADEHSAPAVRRAKPAATPTATTAGSSSASSPSQALVGCVMHLTGDVAPEIVDRATYQSEQVYVIAANDEAWVVGIGCTASHPTVITSVKLSAAG